MKKRYLFIMIVTVLLCEAAFSDTNLKKRPRVVGGESVLEKNIYPWMAALIDKRAISSYKGQFCGASLIDKEWIVTAAHCLFDENRRKIDPSIIKVVLNTYNITVDTNETIVRDVQSYIVHPDYNSSINRFDMGSDIALIKLNEPVDLPVLKLVSDDNLYEKNATVLGWGYKYVVNGYYYLSAQILQKALLPIIAWDECFDTYYEYDYIIDDDMLCAGIKSSKNSAVGDSGGPLLVEEDGELKLAGITSWGFYDLYGVYTRVSDYKEFIYSFKEQKRDAYYFLEKFYDKYGLFFGKKTGNAYECYEGWICQNFSFGKMIAVHKKSYFIIWFTGRYWYPFGKM